MPTSGSKSPEQVAAYYWVLRERELAALVMSTTKSVEDARHYQAVIVGMFETAKTGEQYWEDAISKATQAVRAARTKRTRLRKMIYNLKDTIRIRPNLREAMPPKVKDELEVAERMVDYMDAHGF